LQQLAEAAETLCGHWVKQCAGHRLLYISGETGTGKSHVGRRIERFCRMSSHVALKQMGRGRTAMPSLGYFRWPELANEFRDKSLSALRDLMEMDFLFLDDVGAEDDPFNVVSDKFYQVLSRRENRFTVITSNKSAPDWAQIDPRITDRLLRNSHIVGMNGVPSYAEWKRHNKTKQ